MANVTEIINKLETADSFKETLQLLQKLGDVLQEKEQPQNNKISAPIHQRPTPPITKTTRQKANNKAIELLDEIKAKGLKRGDLTQEQLELIENLADFIKKILETNDQDIIFNKSTNENLRLFIQSLRDNTNEKAFFDYADVSDLLIEQAERIQGLNLNGYVHVIDDSAINHIINQHGNEETERQRNQIAINDNDFTLLADIVTNYDEVEFGDTTRDNLDVIKYRKSFFDGIIYVVEEVRTGRKKLALKTMYKHTHTQNTD